jgi:outer membrane protein assembly factor BamB
VLTGAGHRGSIQCYDKNDGRPLWSGFDDKIGYATPALVTLEGERQIIISFEKRTLGLGPEDGKLLWEYPWQVLNHQMPIAQPVILSSNRFLLSAGYFTGCAAVQLTHNDSTWNVETIWRNKNLKNKFSSSVFWQGHVYGLDEDILTCLDAATGNRRWKGGRYGYGQLLLADGHLIVLSAEGELALVEAKPEECRELARFQAINGKTWNYPALAAGRLLVRNGAEMACFDISPSLR